jgi:hypothetical protein
MTRNTDISDPQNGISISLFSHNLGSQYTLLSIDKKVSGIG